MNVKGIFIFERGKLHFFIQLEFELLKEEIMKRLKGYIRNYEQVILDKKKIGRKPVILYIEAILAFLVLGALTFFIGYQFELLYQINYLLIMSNVVIFLSYFIYKSLTCGHYKKVTKCEHSLWMINSLNYLYVFSIMLIASTLLSFTAFSKAISLVVAIVFLVLTVLSVVTYLFIEKEIQRIKMPDTFNMVLNGFFVAILFYTVTLLTQINIIPLSFAVVMPIMLTLIVIKRYIEKRFIIKMKRIAIIGLGVFLIILSFPFTRSFNYISFYRGEFSFRIIYETLDDPVKEFEEGVTGDVIFYDDYIIVVDDENITFYNDDLVEQMSVANEYEIVYTMNDRLFANKENINSPVIIDLYELIDDDFEFVNGYYVQEPTQKIHLDSNDVYYFESNGYIYEDSTGGLELMSSSGIEDYTVLSKETDLLNFKYSRVFLATPESFMNDVQGYNYDNLAYHNGHLLFTYNTVYVSRNPNKINPADDGEVILYLADQEEYINDRAALQNSIEMPKLFRINEFYFIDGHYYLVGHIEYVNGDKFGKVYIYDDEGKLEREAIFLAENFAVNEDYMAYGEDTIRFYALDGGTSVTYHLIQGYGLMFFTMCLVALFGIKEIHFNPRRLLGLEDEE